MAQERSRKCRDVTGHQAYVFGVIAKQPRSNWRILENILRRQEREEQDKKQKEEQKLIKRESANIVFHNVTAQKNFANQIQQSVINAFAEAENDLDTRKSRLQELLQSEEAKNISEYLANSKHQRSKQFEEMQQVSEQMKIVRKGKDRMLAEEKQAIRYMEECHELHEFREKQRKKEVTEAVLKQIEENKRKQLAEKEEKEMWHQVMLQNLSIMEAKENGEQRKRSAEQKEVLDTLEKQLREKIHFTEECEQQKKEEAEEMYKLRVETQHLLEQEANERKRKQLAFAAEMDEILKKNEALKAQKEREQKMIDDAYCQLVQQELENGKSKLQSDKVRLQQESELFQAYVQEMRYNNQVKENAEDELRKKEMAAIEARRFETEQKRRQAEIELKKDVLHGRNKQLEEKQRMFENIEREKEDELKAWKLIAQNNHQLNMKRTFEKEQERKQYALDLKKQIEENKRKKMEEQTSQLQGQVGQDDSCLKHIDKALLESCSTQTHPFFKKLHGIAV